MNLRSRTLNPMAAGLDAPEGLDGSGRSRDEAPGTVHLFAWQLVTINWSPGVRTYFYSARGNPSLRWFLRSAFGGMIEVVEATWARIRRMIEADITRFRGLVGREAYFKAIRVEVSEAFSRIDREIAVRPIEGGPVASVEFEDVASAEAVEVAALASARPEAPPPDLPRVLSAGGKSGLHSPLN